MPRTDYSSDPDDGSLTPEGSVNEDGQAIGPPPTVQQTRFAPWPVDTATRPFSTSPDIMVASPQSLRSPKSRKSTGVRNDLELAFKPNLKKGPNVRFRAAVHKVMQLNRVKILSDDEPGVDPWSEAASALYGRIKEQCSIEVVDFGPTKFQSHIITNEQLADHIGNDEKKRPLWAKVRWINVGGISWDVIKTLAIEYDIHPLALEDILHGRQTYSSKADYYTKHLFVRLLCHTLKEEGDNSPNVKPPHPYHAQFSNVSSASSAPSYATRVDDLPLEEDMKFDEVAEQVVMDPHGKYRPHESGGRSARGPRPELHVESKKSWDHKPYGAVGPVGGVGSSKAPTRSTSWVLSLLENNLSATQATVNALKKGERVEVKLRNLYIIMYRDGTLISIHQDTNNHFFDSIVAGLYERDTLLRNTADVSLLLQCILNLLAHHAIDVIDRYHDEILKFERDVLIKPKVKTVRYLHIASGDLTMHKRTLAPLKALIYSLRRYDLDRSIAQMDTHEPGFDKQKVVGYISHKSKVHLNDVMDDMDYVLGCLDMFHIITENLINYVFNTVSYDLNTTMRTLTITTVIFFPITFLTGYFGQNFHPMPSVKDHSESFFWAIAIPAEFAICLAFMLPSIANAWHFYQKKVLQKQISTLAR